VRPHKLKDAKKPLRFKVVQKNIDEAIPRDRQHCVLANAICDLPFVRYADIGRTTAIVVWKDGEQLRYILPQRYLMGTDAFDKIETWELLPLNEWIELLPPSSKKTLLAERKRGKVRRTTGDRSKRDWHKDKSGAPYENTGRFAKQRVTLSPEEVGPVSDGLQAEPALEIPERLRSERSDAEPFADEATEKPVQVQEHSRALPGYGQRSAPAERVTPAPAPKPKREYKPSLRYIATMESNRAARKARGEK
jgi:hypothetical protein